jgi:hypothetical protein
MSHVDNPVFFLPPEDRCLSPLALARLCDLDVGTAAILVFGTDSACQVIQTRPTAAVMRFDSRNVEEVLKMKYSPDFDPAESLT